MNKLCRNIALAGIKHCGKSTLGKLLAERCGADFTDSDNELELRYGKPVRELFRELGEEKFRKAEAEVITALASSGSCGRVFSLGGGAVGNSFIDSGVWEQLGTLVMVDIPDSAAQERVFARGVPAYLEKYSDPHLALNSINCERRRLLKEKCSVCYQADPELTPEEQAEKFYNFLIQESLI